MARDGSSGYALQETASSSKPWRHENGIAFALAGGACTCRAASACSAPGASCQTRRRGDERHGSISLAWA